MTRLNNLNQIIRASLCKVTQASLHMRKIMLKRRTDSSTPKDNLSSSTICVILNRIVCRCNQSARRARLRLGLTIRLYKIIWWADRTAWSPVSQASPSTTLHRLRASLRNVILGLSITINTLMLVIMSKIRKHLKNESLRWTTNWRKRLYFLISAKGSRMKLLRDGKKRLIHLKSQTLKLDKRRWWAMISHLDCFSQHLLLRWNTRWEMWI